MFSVFGMEVGLQVIDIFTAHLVMLSFWKNGEEEFCRWIVGVDICASTDPEQSQLEPLLLWNALTGAKR